MALVSIELASTSRSFGVGVSEISEHSKYLCHGEFRFRHIGLRAPHCHWDITVSMVLTLCRLGADNIAFVYSADKTIRLSLPRLKELNHLIKRGWKSFIETIDDSWKKDGWVKDRAPVGVISLHGQNLPVEISGPKAASEADAWESSRNYRQARYLSYASATHYKYVAPLHADEIAYNLDLVFVGLLNGESAHMQTFLDHFTTTGIPKRETKLTYPRSLCVTKMVGKYPSTTNGVIALVV
jgi:hypothetical protein